MQPEMAFITEYLRHHIKAHMEDPKEREEKWAAYVRTMDRNSKRKYEQSPQVI